MDTWEEAVEYDAMDFMEVPAFALSNRELGPILCQGFWMLVLVQLGFRFALRHRKSFAESADDKT